MRGITLRNRLRDLAVLASTVAVLFVGSLALNDRWRQSVTSASQDMHQVQSNPTVIALTGAAAGVVGVIKEFSAENTFLFVFLLVTAVLVVLMLRT
jgi:hypothetical protein